MRSKSTVGGMLLLLLALMLFVLPIQWVVAAVLAAAFHELCHYCVVRLCGGSITKVYAGPLGAQMEARGLTTFGELLSTLAGPLGSFLLLFLVRWLPRTALCAGFQGIYNLLPLYPLDGGRVLRCGAAILLPFRVAYKVCIAIEWICLCALTLLGLYGTVIKGLGLFPLLAAGSIALRSTVFKNTLQTGRVFGTIE